jgi:hypothetical protein
MAAYLHLSASISLPGDSRQRFICTVCCRTTVSASSNRRAWSSTGGGDVVMIAVARVKGVDEKRNAPAMRLSRYSRYHRAAWSLDAQSARTNQRRATSFRSMVDLKGNNRNLLRFLFNLTSNKLLPH